MTVKCEQCEQTVEANEYSDESGKCVYCYADGVGHGGEAGSKSEGLAWIEEVYPMLTDAQRSRAMSCFLSYVHTQRLPYNREECPYPAEF